MATTRNITIEQGVAYEFTITVTDVTDVPIDLTAYTYQAEIRRGYYSTTGVSFTTASANPTLGQLTLSLTDTQASALNPRGRSVFDVYIIDAGGDPTRVLEGIVTVLPQVTRITTAAPTTTTTSSTTTTTTTP